MSWVRTARRKAIGLFVDDAGSAAAIVGWVLLCALLMRPVGIPDAAAALLLFAGLAVILVEGAVRQQRGLRRRAMLPICATDQRRHESMTDTATAILGGGCFWCVEAVYLELNGVVAVQSGYAGGSTPNPSYKEVCSGRTGHAEVVRVEYDPAVLSYDDLLRVFFTIHDPTTLNRQGADVGSQYRSVIFTGSDAEAEAAHRIVAEITAQGVWDAPIVTEIAPAPTFFAAEAEHDNYFALNPGSGYCRVVVAPKVAKFRKSFSERLRKPAA